jgi:hypothetical protein
MFEESDPNHQVVTINLMKYYKVHVISKLMFKHFIY